MSPAQTAVTRRMMIWRKTLRLCLPGWWFLIAAMLFLAPLHASGQVSITISPSAVNLAPNGTQQFTAKVTGSVDTSVIWTIQEGPSGGTVTGSGLYSAPAAVGLYHVVATSHVDNTQSATATIALPGFVTWGLNTPREFADATLLPNGKILFTGGVGPSCASTSAEVYDPSIDRSANTTGMLVARCTHSATLLQNGQVLLAGGQTNGGETATAELFDPASSTFTATGSMTSPRGSQTATLLSNGKVLITGGINCPTTCTVNNTAELYDPSWGTFAPTGSMSVARSGHTATLLSTGNVLIAGGEDCASSCVNYNSAEIYNPTTGAFSPTGTMLVSGQDQTAVLLPSGKVLFVGGYVGGEPSTTAEIYDPSLGAFSQTGNLNIARTTVTATVLTNGTVLIAGGVSTVSFPTAAEIYDPTAGTFALAGSLHEPRIYTTATLLSNGTVVIAGGGVSQALTSTEFYDPATGLFSSHDIFMNIDRTNQAATQLVDGRILITGGVRQVGITGLTPTAEIFDPATGQFTHTGSMSTGRQFHTSTLLPNGQVLIVGGLGLGLSSIIPTAELYDPIKGTFSLTGSPSVPRGGHTATLLPNGKVLIAGGGIFTPDNPATATAELYDPSSGAFSLAGNMTVQRYGHTATLLNSGQVLIAGGVPIVQSRNPIVGAAAELYDPSAGSFTPIGTAQIDGPPFFAPNCQCQFSSFDSILLPSGQVLVGLAYIYDPTLNTFSLLPNTGISDFYRFSSLPDGQVLATDGSFMVFDPVSQHYSLSVPAPINRQSPAANLLSTGQVLVTGGAAVRQADLYQPPLAVPAPIVSGVAPNPVTGFSAVPITVQGANFTSSSVVMDDFAPLQTTFVSGTQLTAVFPLPSLLLAGTHTMEVSNIEDPRIASFNLLVVNPSLTSSVGNSGTLDFPSVNVGSSSPSFNVTYTNQGNAPLKIDSVVLTGPDSADFTIPVGGGSCPLQGVTLAQAGTCLEAIIFTPPSAGTFTATLTVNYETPRSPWVITLSGTGVGVPVATIAPLSLTFGNQAIGTSSAPQSFTITNTGTGALAISNIQVTSGFSETNNCPSSLALGATCSINVTFAPTLAGANGGTVSVATNDGQSHVVQLTGTGFGVPAAAIAPLSLTFGSQTIGTASSAQPLIIASTGTASLAIATIVLSDTADFHMASNCPLSLAPNTNCSLGITFAPSNVGSISGTVTVTASDGGSPHTIQLSGTGTGFALSPAAGSAASATVPAGQTAAYRLSLAPVAFSGSVTLTCAPVTPIPKATCSVSPNPAMLSGTAATVVTVSVSTAAHSGTASAFGKHKKFGPGALQFLAGHWLFYLFLALAMSAASIKTRRIPLALATVILLVSLVVGCNASNNSPGGGGSTGTPAGTYQLVISATSSGATRTIMLNLTVQ
jgi:hypothetical protein